MLVGIKRAEALDTQQGGKKQRLKMSLQRSWTVMQQGKVIAHMPLLIGLYRLRELSHNRLKGMLLLEPLGKHMHADTCQTGRNLDQLSRRLRFFFDRLSGVAVLCLDGVPMPSAAD